MAAAGNAEGRLANASGAASPRGTKGVQDIVWAVVWMDPRDEEVATSFTWTQNSSESAAAGPRSWLDAPVRLLA